MVVIGNDNKMLQKMLTTLEKEMRDYEMKINVGKTKTMKVCRTEEGTGLTEDWKNSIEVNGKITIAKEAFTKKYKVFCNRNPDISFRRRLVKCYVWMLNVDNGKERRNRIEALRVVNIEKIGDECRGTV